MRICRHSIFSFPHFTSTILAVQRRSWTKTGWKVWKCSVKCRRVLMVSSHCPSPRPIRIVCIDLYCMEVLILYRDRHQYKIPNGCCVHLSVSVSVSVSVLASVNPGVLQTIRSLFTWCKLVVSLSSFDIRSCSRWLTDKSRFSSVISSSNFSPRSLRQKQYKSKVTAFHAFLWA